MNDWRTPLTSIWTTLAGVQNAATSPEVDVLESAFARFGEVLQEAAAGDAWKTSLDGVSAVATLMEGLNDALKPLDPKQVRRRERSLAAQPEGIVKPEEGDLPDTPEEEEDANPFSGVFARLSSPAIKRDPSFAPLTPPSTQRQPSPTADPSSPAVKREPTPTLDAFPSARTPSSSARTPSPSPAPSTSSAASTSSLLDPFDIPLALFPPVPIPATLMDTNTGKPTFDGPFIRQWNSLLWWHDEKWNDIGGGARTTMPKGKICANEWCFNIPPTAPGFPFGAFYGHWWHAELKQGEQRSVFFKLKSTSGWLYMGEYKLALDEMGVVTGEQLASLSERAKQPWMDMFSPEPQVGRNELPHLLKHAKLPQHLYGKEIWDAAVAAGPAATFTFAIFRCVGFDTAKVGGWVTKRNERFALEERLRLLPPPLKRGGKNAAKKGGTKGKTSGKGKGKGRRQDEEDEEGEESDFDVESDADDTETEADGEHEDGDEEILGLKWAVEDDETGYDGTEEPPAKRRKRSGR